MSEKSKVQKIAENGAITGVTGDVAKRYGSAIKEHLVSYNGIDNENGIKLHDSLKSISQHKINPDYKYSNMKQRAGYAAEVKDTARVNAERAIKGDPTRKVRTDDLGKVNDQRVDHYDVDKNGHIIEGSGSQMKFVGKTPEEAFDKLRSKKYDKYFESDNKIDVPSDQYDGIIKAADKQLEKLHKQLEAQNEKGNPEQIEKIKQQIERCEKIKNNVRKSTVSTKGSGSAAAHPFLSTAGDVIKVANRAGLQSAAIGAGVGGTVSLVRNLVAYIKGDKEPEEAAKDVAKDTAGAAATAYASGAGGAMIKGFAQHSSKAAIRNFAKSPLNLPGTIATFTVNSAKKIYAYFDGKITGEECVNQLQEDGIGTIGAMYGSCYVAGLFGTGVNAASLFASMAGGMIGYAVASACYSVLSYIFEKDARLAREERIRVEQECEQHIALIKAYRSQLNDMINQYLKDKMEVFNDSFDAIKNSLCIGDIDGFIAGSNKITEALGGQVQYSDKKGFDALMNSNKAFEL